MGQVSDLPPVSGVLLGGGCENRPGLITRLESLAGRNLLGLPAPAAVSQLRGREFWASAASSANAHFPTTMSAAAFLKAGLAEDSRWLHKTNSSAGGLGVRRAATPPPLMPEDSYVQRIIDGRQLGITLIVERHGSRLLGCTESFSSQDWQSPTEPPSLGEFFYRGSWGPIQLTWQQAEQIQGIGDYCYQETGWQGWLQIDCIEDADHQLWILEMNPRWTAGMEVLWRSGTCNPVTEHLKALGQPAPTESTEPAEPSFCGKAVWYAERETTAKRLHAAARQAQAELDTCFRQGSTKISFCDIPTSSTEVIFAGHPGLTIVSEFPAANDSQRQANARSYCLDQLGNARTVLLKHL